MMTKTEKAFWNLVWDWPIGLATLVLQIAGSIDEVLWLLNAVQNPKEGRKFIRDVGVREWIKLYRSHRRWWAGAVGGDRELVDVFIAGARKLDRLSPDEVAREFEQMPRDVVQDLSTSVRAELIQCVRDLAQNLDGGVECVSRDDDLSDEVLRTIEMQFLYRVALPCWIQFKTPPTRLMRRARIGEVEALCQLLSLDKIVVADHAIAKVIHDASLATSSVIQNKIAAAMRRRAPRLSRKRLIVGLGSMISRLSHEMKSPLTEPQIRAVFDLVASAKGELREIAIPNSSEAFAKAIQRSRSDWDMPDIKSARNCPGS